VYLTLLRVADQARQDPSADRMALERAARDAEFICSNQLLASGRIRRLLSAVDAEDWEDERQRFFIVARYESQNNSYWGRRRRWRDYSRAAWPQSHRDLDPASPPRSGEALDGQA
jgi:hypothetical protein